MLTKDRYEILEDMYIEFHLYSMLPYEALVMFDLLITDFNLN